ncbi:hypothetical protein DXU07_08540 [Bradyrhizobium elkanii]|jgi:hypothetical protein|nr:hypothetical protein [Bradyrhizobium brasilense]NWL42469.1 hypothetical protein [Bradyrhizobium elkanii]QOZ15444.1 hypothetical protein XI02_10790 [Bradyrhizobium sp. CCBAU 21365]NWL71694.1 hypothetical protein [Bradyrhizobium elkanii]OIM94970.1 hypothetical protein BLN97_07745 [Bradyrhizobium elkanii]
MPSLKKMRLLCEQCEMAQFRRRPYWLVGCGASWLQRFRVARIRAMKKILDLASIHPASLQSEMRTVLHSTFLHHGGSVS